MMAELDLLFLNKTYYESQLREVKMKTPYVQIICHQQTTFAQPCTLKAFLALFPLFIFQAACGY